MLDRNMEEDEILEDIPDCRSLRRNAERMLDTWKAQPQLNPPEAVGDIFGYLFAKAMEAEANRMGSAPDSGGRMITSFDPAEAFSGCLSTSFAPGKQEKLERAMKLGKQFQKDLFFFMRSKNCGSDQFVDMFLDAAVVVQRIGQLYAKRCFAEDGQLPAEEEK